MKVSFTPQGTCSRYFEFEIEDRIIKSMDFVGGCNGNLQGIEALLKGMKVEDAIARLGGIKCGNKATSCPDQISKGLQNAINEGLI